MSAKKKKQLLGEKKGTRGLMDFQVEDQLGAAVQKETDQENGIACANSIDSQHPR